MSVYFCVSSWIYLYYLQANLFFCPSLLFFPLLLYLHPQPPGGKPRAKRGRRPKVANFLDSSCDSCVCLRIPAWLSTHLDSRCSLNSNTIHSRLFRYPLRKMHLPKYFLKSVFSCITHLYYSISLHISIRSFITCSRLSLSQVKSKKRWTVFSLIILYTNIQDAPPQYNINILNTSHLS